ncbi:MAG: Histone deacetylase-like amidohydrolase [Rhodospirillaceae bacterium]|jgi:acetoin utilization deacetylase AcuC-like enzyme|nr:MAG: Histone deacetylase-like amidohydrolase [Rhodospirillaceae bacterium]
MSTQKTGFFWHEKCFWHGAGNYAFLLPVGDLVEPTSTGFLPEAPETKRRMKNLIEVTGLQDDLECLNPYALAPMEALRLVHPKAYLDAFKSLSDKAGGNLGLRTPFGPGGFEIASLSTGLVIEALFSVLSGKHKNAYALSRPPGHHCLPDYPNGFCLLNNIAVAVNAARKAGKAERVAIVDWDVHHGNGTEHIFYEDPDVLTISLHQERNYPLDTGDAKHTGGDNAPFSNMNIPLMPGGGTAAYKAAFEQLVLPKLAAFKADIVIVACGFDASGVDPLSRMLLGAADFAMLTDMLMEQTGGKLVMAHEGGYSEAHVPFCGHAVLQTMSGSAITAEDPLGARIKGQQPEARFNQLQETLISEMASLHGLK